MRMIFLGAEIQKVCGAFGSLLGTADLSLLAADLHTGGTFPGLATLETSAIMVVFQTMQLCPIVKPASIGDTTKDQESHQISHVPLATVFEKLYLSRCLGSPPLEE